MPQGVLMGTEVATLEAEPEAAAGLQVYDPAAQAWTKFPRLWILAGSWLTFCFFRDTVRQMFEGSGLPVPEMTFAEMSRISGVDSPHVVVTEDHAKHPEWPEIGDYLHAVDAKGFTSRDFLDHWRGQIAAMKAEAEAQAANDEAEAEEKPDTIPFTLEEDGEGDGPYLADLGLDYEPIRPYELVDEITRDFHTSPKGYVMVSRETRTITFRYLD
jgi:hypothetical protein